MPDSWAKALSGLALAAVTGAGHAVPVSFGVAQQVSIRECVAGVTACDSLVLGPARQLVFGGEPGATSSSAVGDVSGFGTAESTVSLSGTIGAPVIKAKAASEFGARLITTSVALQRYTYTGSEATTRTFGGRLTYSQSGTLFGDPDDFLYLGMTGVNAVIQLFAAPAEAFDADNSSPLRFFQSLFFDFVSEAVPLGSDQVLAADEAAGGSADLAVSISLNPGDAIWVLVTLQTPAANGGWVDASHTFITSWDNPDDLIPAIPEPGTIALTCAALIVALRRNRCSDGSDR